MRLSQELRKQQKQKQKQKTEAVDK